MTIKFKRLNINIVGKYYWQKREKFDMTFRKFELGLWFKRDEILAPSSLKKGEFGKHTVNSYTIGINLIWLRFWLTVDYGGLHFKV
jgi:hypothetical protein